MKAVIDNKSYLQKQVVDQSGPAGYSVQTPGSEYAVWNQVSWVESLALLATYPFCAIVSLSVRWERWSYAYLLGCLWGLN